MSSIQSSGPSLSSFQALAKTGEAVALKGGGLQSTSITPAKQGFFGRAVQWVRSLVGSSSSKINADTRAAFAAAVGNSLKGAGLKAEMALKLGGFDATSNKPLSSREIKDVTSHLNKIDNFSKEIAALKKNVLMGEAKHDRFVDMAIEKQIDFDKVAKGSSVLLDQVDNAKEILSAKQREFAQYLKG